YSLYSWMANNSQYPGIQQPRHPVTPMGPLPNAYQSVPMQFRPAGPPLPGPPYMVPQQFLPVGRPNMVSQPMQHLPPRPGLPPPPPPPLAHGLGTPPPPLPAAQAFSVPDGLPSRPILSISPQAQQAVPINNNYMPGQNGPVALPINYNLPTSATTQVPPLPPTEQTSVAPSVPVTSDPPEAVEKAPSDWIEHTSHKGKRHVYYHNLKTKLSSWEKPLDLMSPTERADATTNWKEYKAPDGRKYYYNKVTEQSKWRIPDELKLAREQVITTCTTAKYEPTKDPDNEPMVPTVIDSPSSQPQLVSSPLSVAPSIAAVQSGSLLNSEMSAGATESPKVTTNVAEQTAVPAAPALSNTEDLLVKEAVTAESRTPAGNIEESSANIAALEENAVGQEPLVYENKQDAKNAFKNLLESANIASDWIWDQAMRVIIKDQRYTALRTLTERKQAFSEFIAQKKKQEAEERRHKQKKAREEFKKMLEDLKDLTSSTKWRDAILIFEDDDRFKAVERPKEREDLFDDHITELEKKERSKALEEHKKNRKEYIEFLKSCDFITASSQWRRVQDRLETNESCSRLEKLDRLEIFQEYVRELEKDEEEQRKLRMEDLRKTERKNRDEFRKLMEEHRASGMLTSKSIWRDYVIKVKELPAYAALSSNSSGATPKELFEDVIEELEKQYNDDRDKIKEAVKMRKVSVLSTWTLEDFKNAIAEDISSPAISDVNLKIVFDELLERVREREEKEAKRRKRLAEDFYISLTASKEITWCSRWEDFLPLFEVESWYTAEESFFKEIFDKYISELKRARDERKRREEKAKDRDRRAEKYRRDKDSRSKKDKRRKDDTDSENGDDKGESGSHEENRSGRDKDKKHRRYSDDMSMDESRDSHRHSDERKKTKQLDQQSSAPIEYESRHKRYKRDHRRVDYDDQKEAEDGEMNHGALVDPMCVIVNLRRHSARFM
nr:pre-mRNA-processing protein 40A-like isoform X1 [Tanacetum cinerariifolium]